MLNEKSPTDPENEWLAPDHVRTVAVGAMALLAFYLCYQLVEPFLSAFVWAITLAVVFSPLQEWLERRLRRPNMAATISILLIALIVVLPVGFIAQQLAQQASKGMEFAEATFKSDQWKHRLDTHPRMAHVADLVQSHVNLPEIAKTGSAWLSAAAGQLVKGSVIQITSLLLTFYLAYFFLRDREAVLRTLRTRSFLTQSEMNLLLTRAGCTIKATLYGTVAVAAVQGTLGGLMFWWLGLPLPVFWGATMTLFSVVPPLGGFVVWLPAALFLGATGHWGKAAILVVWGTLVIGTIDNFLRPILVGNRLQIHTAVAFISIIGGIILFGAAGIILGPVILTFAMVVTELWPVLGGPSRNDRSDADQVARFENEGGRIK